MFCHGELTRLKPAPQYLTIFYLMVALGGAVGSLLVGIAAPNLLSGYFELSIALVACAPLLLVRSLTMFWWVVSGSVVVLVATTTLVGMNIKEHLANTRAMAGNFPGAGPPGVFDHPS